MPELPEVETIKEDLRRLVVGSTIRRAEVLDASLVEQPSTEEFAGRLEGVRITGARRRAKHLIVELDSGNSLVLYLDGERRFFLRDETGFTRARLLDAGELRKRLSSLGPEPLEDGFKWNYL